MPRIAPQTIGGLTFAVDRKTVQKPFVAEGKNFLVDLDGPRSVFAYTQAARTTDFNLLPESFTVGLETFQFLKNPITNTLGIFQFNWAKRQDELILDAPITVAYITYKSSFALVGGKQYFCGRGFGVWERDPVTNIWTNVTSSFPTNTFYITNSSGRCIALAENWVQWSALDDARDFVPSTSTGAGAQSLSLIGYPENDFDYRGLQRTANGFLVFMRQGVMKSTSIDNIVQFSHRVITTEYIPLNSWSFARLETDEVIILTAQGLYKTDGNNFELWQPLLSEELKLNVIPSLLQDINGQIQIYYGKHKDWFFVSITQNQNSRIFEKAFVSYLPRGEWGEFNTLHRGFFDVDITGDGSGFQQDQLAFLSVNGEVALFRDDINNSLLAALADSSPSDLQNEIYYSDELYDIPNVIREATAIVYANSNSRGTSNWFVHDTLAAEKITVPAVPAYYEVNGNYETPIDTDIVIPEFKPFDSVNEIAISQLIGIRTEVLLYGHTKQDIDFASLGCTMILGLFRLTDEQQSDQMTFISNVSISMTDIDTASTVFEDWLNDFNPDLIDDWLNDYAIDTIEDWGLNAGGLSSYLANIFGSLDGYSKFIGTYKPLDFVSSEGRTRFYSTETQGLYLLIEIDGVEVGDYIHMKHIEMTGTLAGRL